MRRETQFIEVQSSVTLCSCRPSHRHVYRYVDIEPVRRSAGGKRLMKLVSLNAECRLYASQGDMRMLYHRATLTSSQSISLKITLVILAQDSFFSF